MPNVTSILPDFRYRPEIDGLRAVAVLVVVLFHAGLGIPGGYIGVDVFFVISGYLITSLIITDMESGQFTLVGFWERRARRIIPAEIVVILVSLAAGTFILLPDELTNLGRSASWQALFGGNIYFWRNTSYFQPVAAEKPLLHTWSLAVEEQFYMIVPLLLLGLFRSSALRRRGFLLTLFAVVIILSLGASVAAVSFKIFTFGRPSTAFFLLPTRAWELGCGAFLALTPETWRPKTRSLREFLAVIGLSGIFLPCWFYSEATRFPGLAAIPPCFGTALFLLASSTGLGGPIEHLPAATRLLGSRPVVFIGLISYSLYLWHWPIFAFGTYYALEPMRLGYRLALVGLSIVLALLSWRFVETPFRKRKLCAKQFAMLASAAAGIVVVFGLGQVLFKGRGFPARYAPATVKYTDVRNDKVFLEETTVKDVLERRLIRIGNPDPQALISLLIWGDSHAMAAAPAFDQFLKEKGLTGRQAGAFLVAPVIDAEWPGLKSGDMRRFNNTVFDYILQNHIPDVVLAARWALYTKEQGDVPLDSALIATIERLVKSGVRPWVMTQVPTHQFDVPKALVLGATFDRELTPFMTKTNGWNGIRGVGKEIFHRIESAGGHILNPRPCFLASSGQYYIIQKDGIALYRDNNHLSAEGARKILVPFLRNAMDLTRR